MKKLNLNLIKHSIKTDFFILKNEKKQNTKRFIVLSNKNVNLLDVIELNFLLKQFIRILQFTKKNPNSINIVNSNKQNLKILKSFFLKNKNTIQKNFFFSDGSLKNKELTLSKNPDLNIIINKRNDKNLLNLEINTIMQNFRTGHYKLINDLNSFKKLIFFISVLKNVLKVKKS